MIERDAEIRRLYVEEQLSCARVAVRLGMSSGRVYRVLKRHDVSLRSLAEASQLRGARVIERNAERDAEIVRLYRLEELSCDRIGACFDMPGGTVQGVLKRRGVHLRRQQDACPAGVRHHNWKGGVTQSRGRVYLRRPQHPYATTGGYIRRSHLVWEENTGHVVQPGEVVHHRNGVTDDDTFSNLRLYSTNSQHQHLGHAPDPKRVAEVHRMYAEGLSRAEIARRLGVVWNTVSNWLKREIDA